MRSAGIVEGVSGGHPGTAVPLPPSRLRAETQSFVYFDDLTGTNDPTTPDGIATSALTLNWLATSRTMPSRVTISSRQLVR